jgi:hypothetical protein
MRWATFWATFSQTHRVTLNFGAHERRKNSDALEKLFFFSLVLYFSEGKQK